MPSASPSGFSTSATMENDRFLMSMIASSGSRNAGGEAGSVARHELGPVSGQQLVAAVGHRIDVVLAGFAVEEFLEFPELVWVLGRQVCSEAEIVPHVVELPDVLLERPELFGR